MNESNVLRRLKKEANIDSLLIKETFPQSFNGVLLFDAKTNEDMEQHVERLQQKNLLSMTVGCAGFAKILATKLFPEYEPKNYSLKNLLW